MMVMCLSGGGDDGDEFKFKVQKYFIISSEKFTRGATG